MPKIVDHEARRGEIVRAAWRIIVRDGFDAATMAAIAAEAGFANGALKPYFATKHDLLVAAFEHLYDQTTRRVAAATEGLVGVAALRTYCVEFMPLSDTTDDEARVIIPFWHHALTDPDLARRHEQAMAIWRRDLRRHVRAGIERGEITAEVDAARLIELILTTLHGSQITATVTATPRRSLERQLDDLLHLLTPQA